MYAPIATMFSSALLHLDTLPLHTVDWIWYKCLPLVSLSHNCCHNFHIFFLIIDLISDLLKGIWISTVSCSMAFLVKLSASSLPFNPMWACTHRNWTFILICLSECNNLYYHILSCFWLPFIQTYKSWTWIWTDYDLGYFNFTNTPYCHNYCKHLSSKHW